MTIWDTCYATQFQNHDFRIALIWPVGWCSALHLFYKGKTTTKEYCTRLPSTMVLTVEKWLSFRCMKLVCTPRHGFQYSIYQAHEEGCTKQLAAIIAMLSVPKLYIKGDRVCGGLCEGCGTRVAQGVAQATGRQGVQGGAQVHHT